MQNNTFTVTLADGTQLGDLELNGNNFISKTKVTEDTFRGKLSKVTITGDAEADEAGLIGEHEHMELVQIAHYTQATHGLPDGYYFVLRDIPAAEVGGGEKDQGFDYGLYLDGQPKLMIMILDQYQHRNKCVQRSHKACKDRGIGSFHLLVHLPNRKTYIAERMKECMPN